VNHFQLTLRQPDFAKTAQPVAFFELPLLVGVEIKEAYRKRTGIIGEPGGEYASRPPHAAEVHTGVQNFGFNLTALARLQGA
jgi:hypothetical protein